MRIDTITLDCASMHPDVATVDLIARARGTARRRGARLRLVNVDPQLVELIGFCGLDAALGVEVRRQPEEGKQPRGVEEERELGDPPA